MRFTFAIASLLSLVSRVQAATLVDVVVAEEDLGYLETAVLAAGLEETLAGDGPFTYVYF